MGRDGRRTHHLVVGKPIPFSQLGQYDSDEAMVSHLRLRTYLLGQGYEKSRRPHVHRKDKKAKMASPDSRPCPPTTYRRKSTPFLRSACMRARKMETWDVYVADALQIPKILIEIGRLREYTFRQVGKAPARRADLDTYDNHYKHLFLWDRVQKKIAGAYRMGETDKIIARYGVKGLYNGEYFSFSPAALQVLDRSLEMGRAFIVPEYQKRPLALSHLGGHRPVHGPQPSLPAICSER